jgi:chemotaxis protein MotD
MGTAMTSSAASTAALISNPKASPMSGVAGKSAEQANARQKGFHAAYEAAKPRGRDVPEKSPAAGPAVEQDPTGRDQAWSQRQDLIDLPPAAGDLLLAGGALTPEGDDPVFNEVPLPETLKQNTQTDAKPATADTDVESITAGFTAQPAMSGKKSGVANGASGDAALTRPVDFGAKSGERAVPAATTDPFEDLRQLTRDIKHNRTSERLPASQSTQMPVPEKLQMNAPEPLQIAALSDRLSGKVSTGDRALGGANFDAAQQATVNVTVLEARQYPGAAPIQANAAAIASAISGNESWSAMLRGSETASATTLNQAGNQLNTLKIQLHPAELGSVNAVLRIAGDQLVVELKVETMEAYRQLSDSQQAVLKALRGQGYSVEQISIQHVAPDRSLAQQGSSAGQGNGQAAGESFAQSGQENSPESGSGGRTGQDNGHGDGRHEDGQDSRQVDSPGGLGAGVGADGSVYL